MPDEPHDTDVDPGDPVETGVPTVDEVLRSLDTLAQRPVDQHVEVFERAHEQLRRSLDADHPDHHTVPDTGQAPQQGD
jgi:hypothetical protein